MLDPKPRFPGRLARRSALLLLVVVAVQVFLFGWLKAPSFPEYDRFERELGRRPEVLFFADSVGFHVGPCDTDLRGIGEMLSDELSGTPIAALIKPGYHAGLFHEGFRRALRAGFRGHAVAVEVSLRSFSALWLRNPKNQYWRDWLVLRYGDRPLAGPLLRPFFGLKGLTELRRVEDYLYERLPLTRIDGLTELAGPLADRLRVWRGPERLEENVTWKYAFRLEGDNPLLAELGWFAEDLRAAGMTGVFFLTPVDMETLDDVLGAERSRLVRENAATVAAVLEAHGAVTLDLTGALPSSEFVWRSDGYPNEHLCERGRRFVAAAIAERLRTVVPVPAKQPAPGAGSGRPPAIGEGSRVSPGA